MLAVKADLNKLTYPVICSPKIDGIRAITGVIDGLCSRTVKLIPNIHIRNLTYNLPKYLDGELLTYSNGIVDDFNTVQSKIMSREGKPDFYFHVFDYFNDPNLAYNKRLDVLTNICDHHSILKFVPTFNITDTNQLLELEKQFVDVEKWEGVMIRKPDGFYKFGRSTLKEMLLLKLKRFDDDEAIIIDLIEQMQNNNDQVTNILGFSERSSKLEGLEPTNMLGSFLVSWKDIQFNIGSGFDKDQRIKYWNDKSLIGKKITFKHQGLGSNGAPRFPVFFRFT